MTMPRNNTESFTIFSTSFIYLVSFKNLDWHTESDIIAESKKVFNLFFFFTTIPWVLEKTPEKSNWNCHSFYRKAKLSGFLLYYNGLHESVFTIKYRLHRRTGRCGSTGAKPDLNFSLSTFAIHQAKCLLHLNWLNQYFLSCSFSKSLIRLLTERTLALF